MAFINPKIVIVGGGISGVAAAESLIKAGFRHVRILEATQRSGGRIKTSTLGDKIVEIGANWIHGPCEENPVFRLARQYGLLEEKALSLENQTTDINGHPVFYPNVFTSSGRKLNGEDIIPAEEMFSKLLKESSEFVNGGGEPFASVGEFIRTRVQQRAAEEWKDIDESTKSLLLCMISTLFKLECGINGAHSMDEVGLGAYGQYKTLPGLDCTFPGGFEGLIRNMMKGLPSGLVSYNQPVHCIHWNATEKKENPVTIECDDGEMIEADHVIVTVPLGFLKKHHQTLFSPPLPLHKLHSIQRLGFGTNNKIFVEFDSAWWDAECEIIIPLWEDEDTLVLQIPDLQRSWIKKLSCFTVLKPTKRGARTSPRGPQSSRVFCPTRQKHAVTKDSGIPGERIVNLVDRKQPLRTGSGPPALWFGHLLCGWIAGHESEYMETLSDQEVMGSVTQLVRRFTGNPTITPKRILRSQWFHDPWTLGSYSYLAKGCSVQDVENLMEPLPTSRSQAQPVHVLFAGEATHPCYYSTVHGALLSGQREADRLISYYSSRDSSSPAKSKL